MENVQCRFRRGSAVADVPSDPADTREFHDEHFKVRVDGRWMLAPLALNHDRDRGPQT